MHVHVIGCLTKEVICLESIEISLDAFRGRENNIAGVRPLFLRRAAARVPASSRSTAFNRCKSATKKFDKRYCDTLVLAIQCSRQNEPLLPMQYITHLLQNQRTASQGWSLH